MKTDVSINVIIPVYNTEKYIVKCLNSLLNQTFTDWHAVVVNDGSSDNSGNICREYSEKYSEKFTLYNTEHEGPGYARNYGIDNCPSKAKYLYFCDSDDYLETTALEKLFIAAESAGADMAVCGYAVRRGNLSEYFTYKDTVTGKEEICRSILESDSIGSYVWNKLFSARLFDTVRFPEKRFYEDVMTTYKTVLQCEKIAVISEPLYNYVRRNGSIVTTCDLDFLKDLIKAIDGRNEAIIESLPELAKHDNVSKLEINIYVWNQICKRRDLFKLPECQEILKSIKNDYKIYNKLDKKRRLMANLIRFCPRLYALMIYLCVKIYSEI